MQIVARYSHLNGEEFLKVHSPELIEEVNQTIENVDAFACKTKVSKEKAKRGINLYSPVALNTAFEKEFHKFGWQKHRQTFWVTVDEKVMREVYSLPPDRQKQAIEESGNEPIKSNNQIDFVKDRVAVEIRFGKYALVAHDIFVKHQSFFAAGLIDVGIEILPVKTMEKEMSTGVPYYERDLLNIVRQGRGIPTVPLVMIGVHP